MGTDPASMTKRSSEMSSGRGLQIALGLIWLLDGALQFQPLMFTKGFVNQVLLPSAQGNPGWVADPTISLAHYIEPHIAAWNAFFAVLQVLIGIGIAGGALARRPSIIKTALLTSMVWALMVWWLAEGLGGILQGGSPLSGAPGAVILYGLIAILLWPSSDLAYTSPLIEKVVNRSAGGRRSSQTSKGLSEQALTATGESGQPANEQTSTVLPSEEETMQQLPSKLSTIRYFIGDLVNSVTSNTAAKVIWTTLWVFNGFLLLEPSNQMPQAISSTIKSALPGQPGWLHDLLNSSANMLSGTGAWIDSLLAVAMIIIGAGVALNLYPRVMLSVSIVLSLAIWIFGEGLGGILTGQGTDPNTGPLWIILAGCLWVRLTITESNRSYHVTTSLSPNPLNPEQASIQESQRETVYSATNA